MPKAKPKVPKTDTMWMVWNGSRFDIEAEVYRREDGDIPPPSSVSKYLPVRIVPEAEYQRLIAASKQKNKEA